MHGSTDPASSPAVRPDASAAAPPQGGQPEAVSSGPHAPMPAVPAPPGKVRPPVGDGRRFQLHVFVCVNESACMKDGPAMEIRNALKKKLKAAGLKEEMRINQSGCLGQCGHGPMMVVYPEGVWYSHVGLADVDRIWDEHLMGGRPVAELEFRTRERGTNVLPMKDAELRVVNTEHALWSPCTRCPVQG